MLRGIIFILLFYLFLGCKTTPYFSTSNDFYKQKIDLYMVDGSSRSGNASVLFEERDRARDFLYFRENNSDSEMKVNVKDIKAYVYKGDYYIPKYIDLYGNGVYNLLFVKRLTSEQSKIQLYHLKQVFKSNDTGEEQNFYFISLPAHSRYEVWNMNSINLVPNFDSKMSALVSDCPALAAKIAQKQKGYFYAQMSFSSQNRADVLKRIIDEYNDCK